MRLSVWRNWRITGEVPISSVSTPARPRNCSFSRLSREVSSALCDHQHQPVGLERLFDIVVGAELDGRNRGLDVAVAGNDYHRQVGMLVLDALEHIETVETRALQPDIEDDQRGTALGYRCEGGIRIAGQACLIALVLENAADQFADIGFVIDDEDVSGHLRSLRLFRLLRASSWAWAGGRAAPCQAAGGTPA